MGRMRVMLLLLVAAVVSAAGAGCGSPAQDVTDPKAVVIRFDVSGSVFLSRVPWPVPIAYLADGIVHTPAPGADAASSYPGPVLTQVVARPVAAETIRGWVQTLREAGVARRSSWDIPTLMDAGAVRVVLDDGTGPITAAIYGLGDEEFAGPAVPRDQLPGRRAVTSVFAQITAAALQGQVFEPTSLLARSVPTKDGDDVARQAPAWPGPPLGAGPARSSGEDMFTCARIDVPVTAALLDRLRTTPDQVLWTDAGSTYRVYLRPQLPREPSCA